MWTNYNREDGPYFEILYDERGKKMVRLKGMKEDPWFVFQVHRSASKRIEKQSERRDEGEKIGDGACFTNSNHVVGLGLLLFSNEMFGLGLLYD